MPKYTVERAFRIPVYQVLVIEADSVEAAAERAMAHEDWTGYRDDMESAGPVYIDMIAEGEWDSPHDAKPEAIREVPTRFTEEKSKGVALDPQRHAEGRSSALAGSEPPISFVSAS